MLDPKMQREWSPICLKNRYLELPFFNNKTN